MIASKLVSSALPDQLLEACVHISFNPESKCKHSLQPSQSYYFSDFKFHVACAPSTCWKKTLVLVSLGVCDRPLHKKFCYVLQFHVNFALRCIPHRQSWLLGDTVRHQTSLLGILIGFVVRFLILLNYLNMSSSAYSTSRHFQDGSNPFVKLLIFQLR